MFNKRHYEAIATVMQSAHQYANLPKNTSNAQWDYTVTELACLFQRDSSLFKRERFEAACKPGANVRARKAS
jgi:hypothetical protein